MFIFQIENKNSTAGGKTKSKSEARDGYSYSKSVEFNEKGLELFGIPIDKQTLDDIALYTDGKTMFGWRKVQPH
jgi:hypothetical protein